MNSQATSISRLTIMVGVSLDEARGVVGIGLVLHETDRPGRNGPVIARIAEADDVSGGRMEEFAVLRALQIASARGFRHVKVRSDCNRMRRRLKEDHQVGRGLVGDALHAEILLLARSFEMTKFAFQPRRKNQEAHKLARAAAKILVPGERTEARPAKIR
ncbi:MAG TPA: reverse transcriptase-like protein [Anaeromyxobacteraceae bacterium]|nr:reverse transcriptase-like protein [Anaeromyxobacteraceae bacterium]